MREQSNDSHPDQINSLNLSSKIYKPKANESNPKYVPITFQFESYQCKIILIIILLLILYTIAIFLYRIISKPPQSTIYAGQLHYSRIPYQYWQHRIQMAKSMGLNALSVYVMWNYHQVSRGNFDFSNESKNLTHFLELAKSNRMKVLLRPGPYVCAEWDLGGMPARLFSIEGLIIRTFNEKFLEQVTIYFTELAKIIQPYIGNYNDGVIIMLQIENEYGFFGTDKRYIQSIKSIWNRLNIILPQYYVDWTENLHKSHWEGANVGINNGNLDFYYKYFHLHQVHGFIFGGEVYSGWMTCWGQSWSIKSVDQISKKYKQLLTYNYSFAIYMVHGGTNFGLTAGANSYYGEDYDYLPMVTSYDYDAPINQQGNSTAKFNALQQLISSYATWLVPQSPAPIPMIQIPSMIPTIFGTLFQNLPPPSLVNISYLPFFESIEVQMWHQGLLLYETYLPQGNYIVSIIIRDFALLLINGQLITTIDRTQRINEPISFMCPQINNKISILVEAMGHINWDRPIQSDYKGIISFDLISGHLAKVTNLKWNITTILLNQTIDQQMYTNLGSIKSPYFSKVTFNISTIGDTYFNMQSYGKGYVWINGYNLGRFWNKGPQTKLFCPGVWLKNSTNELIVLELIYQRTYPITGQLTLV